MGEKAGGWVHPTRFATRIGLIDKPQWPDEVVVELKGHM